MAVIRSIKLDDVNVSIETDGNGVILNVFPRLHMFNLDLSLLSGVMKHGSMGFSLKDLPIEIRVSQSQANKDVISSEIDLGNLDYPVYLDDLRSYLQIDSYFNVVVKNPNRLREHTGIGLSSQVIGGILIASAAVVGRQITANDLFLMGLGHMSTLGINSSVYPSNMIEYGVRTVKKEDGLIINPAYSSKYEAPVRSLFEIIDFPFAVIVGFPRTLESLSGKEEAAFWETEEAKNAIPYSNDTTYAVVYEVFERLMPSIIEDNFNDFIESMQKISELGAKPLEEKLQPDYTKKLLVTLRNQFGFAVASSLGPTVVMFSENFSEDVTKLDNDEYSFHLFDFRGQS